MKTTTVLFYDWAASALVNGDELADPIDQTELDRFMADLDHDYPGARVVSCDDEPEYGRPTFGGLLGNVVPYTVHYDYDLDFTTSVTVRHYNYENREYTEVLA